MHPLRVVFYGSPEFAVESLLALLGMKDVEVVAVITQPDKPAGRKRVMTPPPVKVAAAAQGIAVYQYKKLRDGVAEQMLQALAPDIAVVAAYGRILPKALLDAPRCGSINVHASVLPRWRGASPINHAILAGDEATGVSLMKMDEGLDTGPVFATETVPIAPTDTTDSLTTTLKKVGARLLQVHLRAIAQGKLPATAQPADGMTLAPLLLKEHGRLDFTRSAAALARQIRAFIPWPGSFFLSGPDQQERITVLAAHALGVDGAQGVPGETAFADARGLGLVCREGILCVTRLKPAGRNEMTASAWIAGRGGKKPGTLTKP